MTTLKDIALTHDQYTCLESIPGGAQAIVYKVKRHSDETILALKVARVWRNPKSGTKLDESLIRDNCRRIKKEIDFLSRLKAADENYIVSIIDQGEVEISGHQCPAFIMPWYQHTLTKALLTTPTPDVNQRIEWIRQMVIALQHIHRQNDTDNKNLIHRDFKLDNLMLDADNAIRLLDFGISKSMKRTISPEATRINFSPDCVAPEQVLLALPNTDGKKHVLLGPHTDIYALGLVIYYLITKQYPQAQITFVDNMDMQVAAHLKLLNKDGRGLLGKVGGINEDDCAALKQAFINLNMPEPVISKTAALSPESTGTLIDYDEDEVEGEQTSDTLTNEEIVDPKLQQLGIEFADFVREMTNPEHSFRPDAQSARYWIDNMQLRLEKLRNIETTSSEANLPSLQSNKFHAAPLDEELNTKTATSSTHPIYENSTSTPPFSTSEREEDKGQTQLHKEEKPLTKIITIAAALLATVLLAAYFAFGSDEPRPTPEVFANIPAELLDPSENIRQQTWQDLFDSSQNNDEARQQLDNYEKQISAWINSDDEKNWEQAIPGLKLATRAGDENGALWLAYAYQEGRGVDVDWGKTWQQYQHLIEANKSPLAIAKQQKLEKTANAILQDENSPDLQRKLAYQVMATRAKNITTKDNAHLWLAYRFREGDGIPTNPKRAEYWQNRHDGLPNGAVLKRSQP